MTVDIESLLDRLYEIEEALHRIRSTCDAYPEDVFPPMTPAEIKLAVEAMNAVIPHASERLHAGWARHLLAVIRRDADTAIKAMP